MPRALRLPPSKRRRHSYSHNTSETGFDQAVAERERFELSVFGERMPLLGREEGSQITKRGRFIADLGAPCVWLFKYLQCPSLGDVWTYASALEAASGSQHLNPSRGICVIP